MAIGTKDNRQFYQQPEPAALTTGLRPCLYPYAASVLHPRSHHHHNRRHTLHLWVDDGSPCFTGREGFPYVQLALVIPAMLFLRNIQAQGPDSLFFRPATEEISQLLPLFSPDAA